MDYAQPTKKFKLFARPESSVDGILLLSLLAMIGLGLVMVASSSISIGEQQKHDPFYFLIRQVLALSIGGVLAFIILKTESEKWEKWAPLLLVASFVLLILVLIPGIGKMVNGSRRWISMGFFNVQPSEIVKFFVLIYLADYLVRHNEEARTTFMGFLRPMIVVVLLCAFLLSEPDFGASVVLLATSMTMMYLSGVRFYRFLLVFIIVAVLFAVLAWVTPYQLERISSFLNPWADPFDSGYQLTNALMAFGLGGIDGVGLGGSIQKLFYLPEPHTDFVYAVLGEELGLIGTVSVLLLFALFVWRAFVIAANAIEREMYFAANVAYGIGAWIGIQSIINIGVNMGVLPTKGLTLPLMSYGGSSLIVTMCAVALLLRIDFETRQNKETEYIRKY